MQIIDAFRHPVARPEESLLFDLSDVDWDAWHDSHRSELDQHSVAAAGICVMDQNVLSNSSFLRVAGLLRDSLRGWFSILPDLRDPNVRTTIHAAADAGCCGITFHSYLQRIEKVDFPSVVELSQYASELGLFVGFGTAFGSRLLYEYNSLQLVVEVLNAVDCPVVLYHAGGAKVLEALLIADMWDHAYLETSFSLSYWLNSSIEKDFAFAMRKLGTGRVFFGSDAPFVGVEEAITDHVSFMNRHEFSRTDIDTLMGDACRRVLMKNH